MLFYGMSCYHPLVAERLTTKSQFFDPTGKKHKKVHILGEAENIMNVGDLNGEAVEYFTIPCGRCIGCRIDKARDWSVRIMCETKSSLLSSWFLTLTYDDLHMTDLSLNKQDFKDFIKDLRNYVYYRTGECIRYFGCGEYGDSSGRKHYHMIIFNLGDLDIKPRSAKNGYIYYESEIINQLWNKGFVVIAEVNLQTAAYVAKYTLKKQGLKKYDELDIQAPFILMSTRPGIGYKYLSDHVQELINKPYIFMDHKNYSLPRYFKRVLEEEYNIPTEFFNDKYIEKNYKVNLAKEIFTKQELKKILEAEEANLEASQKRRSL